MGAIVITVRRIHTVTNRQITDSIFYAGVNDKTLDLFESQYVVPNGVTYNSYVILDDKCAIMDTADKRASTEWKQNITEILGDRKPDYLVVLHLEPDHSANIQNICEHYPDMKLILSAKAKAMLPQFFDEDLTDRCIAVSEGDELSLGRHTLKFIMAPMVHWPEVMVAYEASEKVLFSADAFGKFGTLDTQEDWTCEARRYYFNIVGKYGAQVQTLLKKAKTLEFETICPLHGPVLTEDLEYYIGKYDLWSRYEPEDDGVFIACASIHGNTMNACRKLSEILTEKGAKKVVVTDLARDDMAEAVEDAFRYDKIVFAAASYDAGVFPCMEEFLHHLKAKNFQNRKAAIVENGSWAPSAGKVMRTMLEGMKNISICDNAVTMKTTMKENTVNEMEQLAEELLAK